MNISSNIQTLSRRLGVSKSFKLFGRLLNKKSRRTRSKLMKFSLLGANLVLLAVVVWFVTGNPSSNVNSKNALLGQGSTALANPLDQLSSADIAVHASRMSGLAEAVAVANQADSESTQLAITPADNIVVSKPQVVSTDSKSAKDIVKYISEEGDTIQSLATKFGVTSDSIRWSNALTSNNISAGKELYIPPVNGIVYVVRDGDTADSIAQAYAANKDILIADNDAEISGLQVGQRILIRDGVQPVVRRATTTAYSARGFSFGLSAIYGYNGYDYGYCTWYVANKRIQIGRQLPANLGDAWTWDDRASLAGLPVNRTPAYGAAVVTASTRRPGHVAFVERVNSDGSVWISEMNSRGQVSDTNTASAGGWGRVNWKLIPAEQANSHNYIH